MKELICTIHLFDLHQYILLNDGSEPPYKQVAITSLDNLVEMLPQMCEKYDERIKIVYDYIYISTLL